MIVGIGTDIVEIERMASSLRRLGDRFAQRLLTESELAEYNGKKNKAAFLAKRFAAKEALVKALGTGFAGGITWKQVHVSNNAQGAPRIILTAAAQEYAERIGVDQIHLSLSDEKQHAIAFVVLEGISQHAE